MKTCVLFIIVSTLATNAYSQLDKTYGSKLGKLQNNRPAIKFKLSRNTPEAVLKQLPFETKQNMPVLKLESNGIFLLNNGKGSYIFIYEPDNMPVLKPDATFKSNMPVAGAMRKEIRP